MPKSSTAILLLLTGATLVASQLRYTIDITVRYFVDVTMLCDHPDLNITEEADVRSISWLFPNGRTVHKSSDLDPRFFTLSEPSADIAVAVNRSTFAGYNLTAYEIDLDVFGYYSCIVTYDSPAKTISVIRWGLNIDGPDYSELLEVYRKAAIVGGVAAAIFCVLVVGTCIVWHFCFSDNKGLILDESTKLNPSDTANQTNHSYVNMTLEGDADKVDFDNDREIIKAFNTKM